MLYAFSSELKFLNAYFVSNWTTEIVQKDIIFCSLAVLSELPVDFRHKFLMSLLGISVLKKIIKKAVLIIHEKNELILRYLV